MTDREKLIEKLDKSFAEQYEKRRLLTAQHTADYLLANGVILPIRCKDCIYAVECATKGYFVCSAMTNFNYVRPNHFCSYGELKEREGK